MKRIMTLTLISVSLTLVLGASAHRPVAASPSAVPQDIHCNPRNVVVWTVKPRVHVQCTETFGSGVRYFAYPAQDPDAVARVLTILTAARAAGQTLLINVDMNDTTSGPPFGCAASDCRVIRAVGF